MKTGQGKQSKALPHYRKDREKKVNPQKGQVGIVERIKKAKTKKEVGELLKSANTYKFISNSTLNRVKRIAKEKLGN